MDRQTKQQGRCRDAPAAKVKPGDETITSVCIRHLPGLSRWSHGDAERSKRKCLQWRDVADLPNGLAGSPLFFAKVTSRLAKGLPARSPLASMGRVVQGTAEIPVDDAKCE
eukprot:scaffold24312_cov16-Prasinocladus_malaysianus.AAC.1